MPKLPMTYTAPLESIKFMLYDFLDINEVLALDGQDFNRDIIYTILQEAASFAENELAPINKTGDIEGCKLEGGAVKTPNGFIQAYKKFVENGWNSLPFPQEYGGQGLPWLLSVAIAEMWNGANMAFSLCPLLTQGGVELLVSHGSAQQKDKYLQKLISGEWTGTMCLTESQAGSDLAAIRTTATPSGGHYLIHGQKIFITYGDHDLSDNIIHMVLARTPNSPEGVKGISLFIVPKYLEDGTRNDLKAISIEHKLGIHASPTAVMSFGDSGGATGYLVGEENQGLKYMFTMMNNARLSVGVEGLGISESSYQMALAYANQRVQGVPIGAPKQPVKNFTISGHADVARMLLTIRSHTMASRAIIYYTAYAMDIAHRHKNQETKQLYQDIVDLLIPVAKAHSTELGFSNSSLALQVFGGIGYIEETGIAQNLRDSRITMIYEGTNGIQAMDLVFRKLVINGGRLFDSFVKLVLERNMGNENVAQALGSLVKSTKIIQQCVKDNPQCAAGLAAPYLRLFGITLGALFLNNCSKIIEKQGKDCEFSTQVMEATRFYNENILPEINYLTDIINRDN